MKKDSELRIASTEMDDFEAMPSWLQRVLTQESQVGKLPTPTPNRVHLAMAQGLEELGDVLVGDNTRIDEFERVQEDRDRLPEEVKAYEMKKEKLASKPLEKEVGMEARKQSIEDLKRTVNRLETQKRLSLNTK